ncbi:MAG: hypothetical protein H7X86_00465, partial [Gorillibacterium sp.]|nr:hypothetical protein [Gorillibacterium sp.]
YASMGRLHIEVEDNGKGMPPDELANLQASLRISAEDFSGCGLWNVNQRMLHHFGSDSFMVLEASEWNGLKVSLVWNLSTNGGETNGGEKDV